MTAAPTKPEHLEEVLNEHGMDAKAQEAIRAYVDNSIQSGLAAEVDEHVKAAMADYLREQEAAEDARPVQAPRNRSGDRGHLYNPQAAGAKLDGKFENIGQLFADLHLERQGVTASADRLRNIRNAFSSTSPADGGFLVPEEFRSELMTTALEGALVRPRARVIPMGVPRIKLPMLEDTSHASTLFGGVTAYWSEERGTLVNSSPKFGQVTLDTNKLTMRTSIPNELVADSSVSVTSWVDQSFPTALRWYEDEAFIRGNGVGKPLGFMDAGNTALVTVAAEGSGNGAGTIIRKNITKMYARMLPTSLSSAVWLANIDTFPALAELAAADSSPVWLNSLGNGGPPMTILGRPLFFTEKMESLSTAGDIAFVDLSHYVIGDRQQMTAMWSEHVEFDTDSVAYRLISRVDGRPLLKNPITPAKGASTLSPFVTLGTRSG